MSLINDTPEALAKRQEDIIIMCSTIDLFNTLTGHDLSVDDGLQFMEFFFQSGFHVTLAIGNWLQVHQLPRQLGKSGRETTTTSLQFSIILASDTELFLLSSFVFTKVCCH